KTDPPSARGGLAMTAYATFLPPSADERRVEFGGDGGKDYKNQSDDAEIGEHAVGALAGANHQRAERVHQVSQRIQVGDDTQPMRHDRNRINCVAGEK